MNYLVTGATGLVGSHIAEQLSGAGEKVRCLVRQTSNADFLDSLHVEKVYGDITKPASLKDAFRNIDIVFHCAARVSDWGAWEEFEETTVQGIRNCLEAALQAKVTRFVQISTDSVYGFNHPDELRIDEMTSLENHFDTSDSYGRAKVAAEELVWKYAHVKHLPVTVLRPGWIYGPRDNMLLKRAIRIIKSPLASLVDGGNGVLNMLHASDGAAGAILASKNEKAINQVYNIHSDETVTAKEFFDTICGAIGEKHVTRSVGFTTAYALAATLEMRSQLRDKKTPPLLTRYAVKLLSRKNGFDAQKAKQELDWQARIPFQKGMRDTIQLFLQTQQAAF